LPSIVYKEVVKGNKTDGISDSCLCIAAMTGRNSPDLTGQAMETVNQASKGMEDREYQQNIIR